MAPITGVMAQQERINPILLKSQAKEEAVPAEELSTESTKPEILLFAKKAEYTSEAPKMTAVSKPTFEHTGAAAASSQPAPALFTTNSEGRFVVSAATTHAAGGATELASALSGAESNEKGGDKKEEGNSFLAAHKNLTDTRLEELEKDEILGSILSLC